MIIVCLCYLAVGVLNSRPLPRSGVGTYPTFRPVKGRDEEASCYHIRSIRYRVCHETYFKRQGVLFKSLGRTQL